MSQRFTTRLQRHLLQALIWGSFTALMLYLSRGYGPLSSGGLTIALVVGLGLWVCSELLRHIALRQRWLERHGPGLVWRVALAVLLLPIALQLLLYVVLTGGLRLGWLEMPGGRANYDSFGVLIAYWLNSAMPLAIWATGWLSVHAVSRFREGELSRLRAEAAASALELDALRARLNPHFVFNALNNLRALINEDGERARLMVTQLSNTLRHALDHGNANSVSLRRELEVVDDYLAIEKVHYEERLQIERDVDDAALDANLPPMLLQLLVENAIKHGIACTPGGGRLRLRATRDAGTLRVVLENPGRLQQHSRAHGVGLNYLRNRLAQLAGARFDLVEAEGMVRATLEIPQ